MPVTPCGKQRMRFDLNAANGVRVRLAGSVPLNDEEFAASLTALGWRPLFPVFLVLVSAVFGDADMAHRVADYPDLDGRAYRIHLFCHFAVGSLNLISVAFAVMFIGIAVDFGIQFGVRYRDQHHREPGHAKALTDRASVIAVPLAMAAGSTALGFSCLYSDRLSRGF